jgi:tetratricopeptide (TPR) repeat protein
MSKCLMVFVLAACVLAAPLAAYAQLTKGSTLPPFEAVDIYNRPVDLEALTAQDTDLVILFFFTPEVGDEIAMRLRSLYKRVGEERLYIAAVGLESDEPKLKDFAESIDIDYYVLPDGPQIEADIKYGPFSILPLTFIASTDRTLLKIVAGGGAQESGLINYIAQTFLSQGRTDEARAASETAIESGEDAKTAKETTGFAFAAEGKLDEADAEFKEIDSVSGQAAVEMKRGNLDKAIALAREAQDKEAYANTVLGTAYMKSGKLDDAEAAFGKAVAAEDLPDWQKSESLNGSGRIAHEKGNLDTAIEQYKSASTLDHYNITALSNEGAAFRQTGGLEAAKAALEKAQTIAADVERTDQLTNMMLRQVVEQLERANDIERLEFIKKQIEDLSARYKELQAEGEADPVDPWTSRPRVIAFLDVSTGPGVFFERAGTDLTIKREIERLTADIEAMNVVERDKLELLLQELNLGSSELADDDTQLALGKILAARALAFIEFGQLGASPRINVRLVDTETTRIMNQIVVDFDPSGDLEAMVQSVVEELEEKLLGDEKLQGLIAQAEDPEAVLINLGSNHGIQPGMRFAAVADGEPITVGGRTVPGKPTLAGTLEVTEVINEQLSQCKVVETKEGAALAPEVKIKQLGN